MINIAVEPTGTQAAQIPIAVPRRCAANHWAMIAGANTAMKLVPIPAMTRLASNPPALWLSAPSPAPRMIEPPASSPIAR